MSGYQLLEEFYHQKLAYVPSSLNGALKHFKVFDMERFSGEHIKSNVTAKVVLQLFAGESHLPNGEAVLVDRDSTTCPIQPMRYDKQ